MKAIRNEIIEELEELEKKAQSKKLEHKDLEMIKHLCETLFALDEVKEHWHEHHTEKWHESNPNPLNPQHNEMKRQNMRHENLQHTGEYATEPYYTGAQTGSVHGATPKVY